MRWSVATIAASVALVGCGEVEFPVVSQQPIVYGQVSGQADDAVVYLQSPGGNCSGTLVAPNLVLTARHCFAIVDRLGDLGCNQDGVSVTDAGNISNDYEPAEISVLIGPAGCTDEPVLAKRFFSTGSQTVCRNDLALIELATEIMDWPMMPMRLLRPTSVGETMSIMGFGRTDDSDDIPVRRRRDGLSVLAVGANRFDANGGMAVAGTFVLSQGACHGDSGGPAKTESTGAVAGVYSINGAKDCADPTAIGVYVQIAEYYDLILNAFDSVGAQPWLEGEPMPSADHASASGCSMRFVTGASGLVFVEAITAFWLLLRRLGRNDNRLS